MKENAVAAPDNRGSRAAAAAALFGCVLCWSAVPVLLRQLRHSIDPWSANGFRYPLAALLYWPILLAAVRRHKLNRQVVSRCLVPGLFALLGQVFWALAPYYLEAISIGFFVRMSVVWSLIGSMLLFEDERRLLRLPAFYVGLAFTVVGFLALASSKTNGVSITGVLIMVVCSFFFGCYAISVRYFLKNIHPLVSFGVVSQVVSIGTITVMMIVGPQDFSKLAAADWTLLVASALLGIAIGHVLLYTAVIRLGPTIASAVQSVTPFITMALAMLFLGESMTPMEIAAGTTMFVGAVVLVTLKRR